MQSLEVVMDRKNVITLASDSKPVLTPFQALARYREELSVKLADNTMGMLPGVIGTIFFERGSQPDVRQ
ncbi:hypothetical protein [Burkholderia gladioli]|uniref:hypothetical protein n=1 Tax=Burkholderia gladioli TaxID=28095 RepID=UPI003C7DBCB2